MTRRQPYAAFSDAIFLSGEFTAHADQLEATDPFLADHMRVQAMRVEFILCGALSALQRDDARALDLFLRSEATVSATKEAIHAQCRNLVNFPLVHATIRQLFEGSLKPLPLESTYDSPPRSSLRYFIAPLVWVVAHAYPPLERLDWVIQIQPSPRLKYVTHTLVNMTVSGLFILVPYARKAELALLLVLLFASLVGALEVFALEVKEKLASTTGGGQIPRRLRPAHDNAPVSSRDSPTHTHPAAHPLYRLVSRCRVAVCRLERAPAQTQREAVQRERAGRAPTHSVAHKLV